MLSGRVVPTAAVLFFVSSIAGGQQSAAPFADKVVDSYSNGNDPVTKQPFVLHWGDLQASDFGPRTITFSEAGLRALHPAPAPGVHPRILFSPEDLPAMRQRMKQQRSGQIMYRHLEAFSEALRGRYDESAAYAKPDLWKGNYRGSHANVQLWYYHDKDSPFNPANRVFARLMAGDPSVDPKPLWPVFAIDALRCLVDDDAASAQQLARAVITAMIHDQRARDEERLAKKVTEPLKSPVSGGAGGQDLAYIYDFIYNWLTPEQKQAIHDELAAGSWSHDNYGTFNAAVATRSNWATFTYWLMPLLAIEGEPGYNELKAEGIYRGYRNFLTYGVFADGAVVEGEAKDQLGGDGLVAMAMRRRPDLFGHPYLASYVHDFLPHSIVPNTHYATLPGNFGSGPFLRYDLLGGLSRINAVDAVTLKYMFPNDKVIDWVYRVQVGDNYEFLPNRGISGYWDDLLLTAIFATDFDPANNDPARLGLDPTFFSGRRAMMLTRSDWSSDAMELGLHVRQLNGGHPYADRNSIFLFAQGRLWIGIDSRVGDNTVQSEMIVDRHAQSALSPARLVDYVNTSLATFAVGDAKYTWDWNLQTLSYGSGYTKQEVRDGKVNIPKGWEPEMHSINDFAYTKMAEEYANAPLFHLNSWIAQDGLISPMVREPNYPVKMAFRTAGLVRGSAPYSLVVDDMQKDDSVHRFDWQVLLEEDLKVIQVAAPAAGSGVLDVTLAAGTPKPGDPVLLVRVLGCSAEAARSITAKVIAPGPSPADKTKPILVISTDAVSPGYKIMLFAYRQGDSLPTTQWNPAHDTVAIGLPGYSDEVHFSTAASGKTDLRILRKQGGHTTEIVNMNKFVTPMPEGAPSSAATQIQ